MVWALFVDGDFIYENIDFDKVYAMYEKYYSDAANFELSKFTLDGGGYDLGKRRKRRNSRR